jgi:hypothetical protein
MLVGAISLTRIAGDYLGFPPGFEWTFTGAVDVAGIAGGIMWTAFSGPVRNIGRPMNIVCTAVSGVFVGLDHATHAGRALRENNGNAALAGTDAAWPFVAFTAGLFVPALATWILHALSTIADSAARSEDAAGGRPAASAPDRQAARPPAGDRLATTVVAGSGDHQTKHVLATASPAPPAGPPAVDRQAAGPDRQVVAPDRQPATARPDRQVASGARPPAGPDHQRATAAAVETRSVSTRRPQERTALPAGGAAVPSPAGARIVLDDSGPRPPWMTKELVREVAGKIVAARLATPKPKVYGRGQLMAEYGLTDHKATVLLAWIKDHNVIREAA